MLGSRLIPLYIVTILNACVYVAGPKHKDSREQTSAQEVRRGREAGGAERAAAGRWRVGQAAAVAAGARHRGAA